MSEKNKIIFETTDPMQNVIYLTSDRFEHITQGHPEMFGEENNIKLAVENPDNVYKDKDFDTTFCYFKQHNSVILRTYGTNMSPSATKKKQKTFTKSLKLQKKKTPRLDLSFQYDSEADILYASVGKPKPAKSIDFPNGIVLRIDPASGNYIGFTIINYMARKKRGSIKKIPHFSSVELPVYSYPS